MAREALVTGAVGATGSRSLLRRMNSGGILRAVIDRAQTVRDLSIASGLSRTAVDAIVSDLVCLGWLSPTEVVAGRLGRPAVTYRLASGIGHFLSIDIGANHVHAVLTEPNGRVRGQLGAPTEEAQPAEERVLLALRVADRLLNSLSLRRDALWAVAVGSPGVISPAGVVRYFGGTGMPGWTGLDLRERFAREFDAAVLVEGDVALGAHAELAFGAARGCSDVVYILCGVRTSGAVIVDGQVHRGFHGAAGIVGELPELRWAELNEHYGSSVLGSPRPSRQEIFDRARRQDPAAVAAVDEFADDLATGAAALALALDPELIVIGGGSAPGADVFLDRFRSTVERLVPLPPKVVVSTLGSEAVAMGGISLAVQRMQAMLADAVRDRDGFPSPAEVPVLMREVV